MFIKQSLPVWNSGFLVGAGLCEVYSEWLSFAVFSGGSQGIYFNLAKCIQKQNIARVSSLHTKKTGSTATINQLIRFK